MKPSRTPLLAALAAGVLAASLTTVLPAQAATPVTYYVNNLSGSNCSDSGPGTSTAQPWCTFTRTGSVTLKAGDSLLLARGASWSQELSVGMSGSPAQPATIGAYGTGGAPRIPSTPTGTGISLTDPTHAVVTGLDIGDKTSSGSGALAYGIMATYTTLDNNGLTFSDLSVHDSSQIGVLVRATAAQTATQTALTGLTFSRVTTSHNAQGIAITRQGTLSGATPVPGNDGDLTFQNVLVDRYSSSHDDANQTLDRVSETGVPCVALTLQAATNVVVRNSTIDTAGACRTAVGTTSLFLGQVNHVLLANNMIVNAPNTQNPDMTAIDYESLTNDVKVVGSYFADNYGGAIEYLAIHGPSDFSTAGVASSNVFIRNGYQNNMPYPGGGAITQHGGSIPVQATVSDNLYHEPYAFLTAQGGGSLASFTSANNTSIGAASDISHAAAQFGASPWGYQQGSGSTWTALTYHSSTASYTGSGTTIDKFTLTPAATTGAGLTWTAPTTGVISLRGYPMTESGTTTATVTRNGTTLATASVGTSGTSVKADDLAVTAGDVIRFSVPAGAATVSWAPSLAYTSTSANSDPAGTWSFAAAGDPQGWTTNATASVNRGHATVNTVAGTTTMDSPDSLGLPTANHSAVRLDYANNTSATSGRIYFTTAVGQSFTTARSVKFSIEPKSTAGLVEGFRNTIIPMSGNANWTGTIQRIRIELTSVAGTFLVDRVQLTKPAATGWEFGSADGWTAKPDVSCATTGTPSASPTVDVDNTSGTFTPHDDINWNYSRMQQFTVSTPRLAQIDFWAYKSGSPAGCLYFSVVKITDSAAHKGTTLFTGAVPASSVTTTGGYVSVYPGLTGLDTAATYALVIHNPYVIPDGGTYGLGFSDSASNPAASFGEYYSADNRGTWNGPETNRSLNFRTYTAATIATQNPTAGYSAVTVSDGVTTTTGGYEPAFLSPGSLAIPAASTRYVHIRMNNPDNRSTAYLLFTTSGHTSFDQPGVGWPVPNEQGLKGTSFSLLPGSEYHEYVLDMSTVPGWTGTVQQFMFEPATRWNYRIGSLSSTWSGKIDHIRFS
ncbi:MULTISPECIES: hypothetical protein [unclassified Streptomyces]|uniref:hypothetical protein n=1 Tax=unclassified Streptomyces TaxID=2593676 RepID=UPI0036E53E37